MRARRLVLAATAAVASLALWVPAASATFHLTQVREVFPGTVAHPGSEYVELQMWAGGQNFVGGHTVSIYDATGKLLASNPFPSAVAGDANQSTIVIASPEAEAELHFTGDGQLQPLAGGQIDPAGGAVCWESIDCVSWGSFSGSLPSPAGRPADPGGIPDGMAIQRSIAAGCATLLELGDDHDDSATDFAAVAPAPRPNSVAPSERACGGAGPSASAPNTVLRRKPAARSHSRTASFGFASSELDSRFECSLDGRAFRGCRSPFTAKALKPGAHLFRVRAVNDAGRDPSPASFRFKVLGGRAKRR